MGNCVDTEKQVKYDCPLCKEAKVEPQYYTTNVVEIELIDGKIVKKPDSEKITKYDKYGNLINERKFVVMVTCSNNHEYARGRICETQVEANTFL